MQSFADVAVLHSWNIPTLCPELSAGILAGVVISKTELDRPSETWACAASICLASSPYP